MALRIDLKPHERLIIGDVSIRNGDRRASLTFETKAKFLREKDILTQGQAKTACEKLYVLLQAIYLTDNDPMIENAFVSHAGELVKNVPTTGFYVFDINAKIQERDFYQALKIGQDLMNYEKFLLKLSD